jgi:hypothetical protein
VTSKLTLRLFALPDRARPTKCLATAALYRRYVAVPTRYGHSPPWGTVIPEELGVERQASVVPATDGDVERAVGRLPKVKIRLDETPEQLNPRRVLTAIVDRVLGVPRVTMHKEAGKRQAALHA